MCKKNIETTISARVDGWKVRRVKSGKSARGSTRTWKTPVFEQEFLCGLSQSDLPNYHTPANWYRWASEGGWCLRHLRCPPLGPFLLCLWLWILVLWHVSTSPFLFPSNLASLWLSLRGRQRLSPSAFGSPLTSTPNALCSLSPRRKPTLLSVLTIPTPRYPITTGF